MNRRNPIHLNQICFWRYFIIIGSLAVTYFGTAKLAFSTLDLGVEASPFWPPAGISLAALLLEGGRIWPGVLLGALLFARSLGVSWTIAWSAAIGSALQAVLGAALLHRMRFHASLKQLQDVLELVVVGAWVSPLISATFTTLVGYLNNSLSPLGWEKNWWTLWLGDGMGILVVTPFVLIWSHSTVDFRWSNQGSNVQSYKPPFSEVFYINLHFSTLMYRIVNNNLYRTPQRLLLLLQRPLASAKTLVLLLQKTLTSLTSLTPRYRRQRTRFFGEREHPTNNGNSVRVAPSTDPSSLDTTAPYLLPPEAARPNATLTLLPTQNASSLDAKVSRLLPRLRRGWRYADTSANGAALLAGSPVKDNPQFFFYRSEAIVCLTLLCTVSWVIFTSTTGMGIAKYPIEYLPFPLVVWVALRFAQRGAVIATLIVCWIAFWGAAHGVGPFIAKASGDKYQVFLFLQAFMEVVTISALVLAAAESERTTAVDLLKQREASLANAQRLAHLGNWDLYETCQGRSIPQQQLQWSDELYRLFGFDPKVVKPSWEVFFQIVHPADRERVGQAIRGALRENRPYCIDYRIVLPDGSERVVCEQSEINNRGISGTVQDITERKQVEAQLYAAAERERLLGEMALRIRRSLNLDRILNTTVAEVRQFLGADRVFIGQIEAVKTDFCQSLQGLVIAESVEPLYSSLRSLSVDDEASLEELRSLFEQNCVRVIEDTDKLDVPPLVAEYYIRYQVRASLGVPILLGDEIYGALVVNQCQQPRRWQSWEIDWLTSLATQVAIAIQQAQLYRQITDLAVHLESQVEERTQELSAKMTELQELNQLKDVFLQAVSHDLRTSLLGMSMVLKNLHQSSGDAARVSHPLLERMMMSNERQLNLINSLLEDHFNEERELDLHCEPVQLDRLIQNLIADWGPKLAQNQATLTHRLPTEVPVIAADPRQLRQVLDNLLTNALTHNPQGLNLTLQLTVEEQMIRCTLEDNGVGISQEQHNHLFKLYIRGLHTQHLTGIGLGLYQCRQIINAHDGEIGVISVLNAGSTFWFTLPLSSCPLDRFG